MSFRFFSVHPNQAQLNLGPPSGFGFPFMYFGHLSKVCFLLFFI